MPKFLLLSVLILLLCPGYAQRSPHEPAFLHDLIALVQKNHIASRPLDDALSKEIFYSFLQQLDPDKKLFTLDEINELKLSEASLDDELNNGSTHFLDQVAELLNRGVKRAEKYAQDCLEQEADLFIDAYFETNPEKNDFVGEADLQKRWALIIKKQFNEALYITEIVAPNQAFEESKSMATGKIKAYFRNYFNDLEHITYNKLLEMYLNAYVSALDYQSAFLTPESKAAWDNDFNRNFVGIGISIETTIDYPVITEVMLDGPAWKTGKIHSGDILLKISDQANQLIDVAGMPVAQVLDLLRGEPGSKVKISIKTSKNNLENIEIERGSFSLPKTMSFILEDKTDHTKVGYLYLPRFYAGEESCSVDVSEELKN